MLGTLRDAFAGNVARWPDRTAIICGERVLSFADLDERANHLAHFLTRLGVRQGDIVGLLLTNSAEFAIGFVACQKLGVVSSALNYRLAPAAIAHVVCQENLKALIFNVAFADKVGRLLTEEGGCHYICVGEPVPTGALCFDHCLNEPGSEPPTPTVAESDICNIIHTSGTTGRPKGAAFTHGTQLLTAIQYCLEMGLDRGHVGMSLAPVVIGAATNFFVAYLFVGATQVMIGDYDAEKALRLMARHKVTEAFAVPTQMYQLVEARQAMRDLDIGPLRLLRSGGSQLADALLRGVQRELGCEVLNTYGTTESCTAITTCHTGLDPEDKWESIGKASYFQEVRVIRAAEGLMAAADEEVTRPGDGQLINRGPQCAPDYFRSPGETLRARDGWQYTRDVVRVDPEGYIYPVDRMDNVIISGGENIYPQEVEFFLSKHPAIADVAVCGAADPKWGQLVKALIVRRSPDLTVEKIERYCLDSGELSRNHRPKIIEFVSELPRNVLGKIDRTALR